MADVQIRSPRKNSKNPIKGGGFVASGIAKGGVVAVVGTCTPATGDSIQGVPLHFIVVNHGTHKGHYLWSLGFKVDAAAYTLSVVGLYPDGTRTPPETVTLPAQGPLDPRDPAPGYESQFRPPPLAVIITGPEDTEDITTDLCSGTFNPGGTLTENSVLDPNSVVLTRTDTSEDFPAGYASSYDIYWWAFFDQPSGPFDSGPSGQINLVLSASDTTGAPARVVNVTATLPC